MFAEHKEAKRCPKIGENVIQSTLHRLVKESKLERILIYCGHKKPLNFISSSMARQTHFEKLN